MRRFALRRGLTWQRNEIRSLQQRLQQQHEEKLRESLRRRDEAEALEARLLIQRDITNEMEITPYQVRWPTASETQSPWVSALDMAVLKEAMPESHLDCMVGD